MGFDAALRAQSAMEYLMTYGWAILIIAVVLGALFELGFFNSASLAPKVGPGSCQVYRPQGPGTTAFESLEGTCNNELPQYVGGFGAATASVNTLDTEVITNGYDTISFWMYGNGGTGNVVIGFADTVIAFGGGCFGINAGGAYIDGVSQNLVSGKWVFVTVEIDSGAGGLYDGSNYPFYINGVAAPYSCTVSSSSYYTPTVTQQTYIGNDAAGTANFNGQIADVQIYNTTLSSGEVESLYQEGIGGVPIGLDGLTGWWPLNGNANDYSGNLNNGVPTSVVYTSSWTSKYSAP